MKHKSISTFKDYLDIIDNLVNEKHEIILYRGQSHNSPLLPSICRTDPKSNTLDLEIKMLEELQRRTKLTLKTSVDSDWEWLVYAQHFGMKTRLLDWSSNPLTALWFACFNEDKLNKDSYVYIFVADNSFLIDTKTKESPFDIGKTRILRPALNNERIIAQAGWFTAHRYASKHKRFIPLEENTDLSERIIQVKIPSKIKNQILEQLSIFGINSQVLFPDIIGICSHLNWMYTYNINS